MLADSALGEFNPFPDLFLGLWLGLPDDPQYLRGSVDPHRLVELPVELPPVLGEPKFQDIGLRLRVAILYEPHDEVCARMGGGVVIVRPFEGDGCVQ